MTDLKGKTIALVRKMTDEEMKMMGWYKRPHVIQFTDGTLLIPQSDDEGNDGGVFAYQGKTEAEDYIFGTY